MKKKIMIVDDDTDVSSNLKAVLEHACFEITCYNDAESALKMIKADKPDLVLLDVMMPGISGFEACEKIKSDPDTLNIPVIMLTAKDMGEDVETALKKKADWFIVKPPDNKYLIAKINYFLTKK